METRMGKISKSLGLLALLLGQGLLAPQWAQGGYADSNDPDALPPFLGGGVEPNLLLAIDNSGSMYDLVYKGQQGVCYDGPADDGSNESYNSAIDYSGYFRPYVEPVLAAPGYLKDGWYQYNLATGAFEESATPNSTICDGATYKSPDVCVAINTATDPDTVTGFAARGNFLNWATASKLDVQKKVLTGGKYDSANQQLILESRGCMAQRFVKKAALQNAAGATYYLTLGVRQPLDWVKSTVYPGQSVAVYNGIGYYTALGGTSSTTPPPGDTGVTWVARDYNYLTQIELFPVTTTGFQFGACLAAMTEMASDQPALGTIKGLIDECLASVAAPTTYQADSNAAFNHSTQDCWYMDKQGLDAWEQTANGSVTSMKNDCEKVYADIGDPTKILYGDAGYVCWGYRADPLSDSYGYVGRCWNSGDCVDVACTTEPATGAAEICKAGLVYVCPYGKLTSGQCKHGNDVVPEANYVKKQTCTSSVATGWAIASDACVKQALLDYCGSFSTPQVIDPSDQVGSVSEDFFNAPANLVTAAVTAQVGQPLAVFNGLIDQAASPTGLLQGYASQLRLGAMVFNAQGQASECAALTTAHVSSPCGAGTLDGARIISYLDRDIAPATTHKDQLISAINDIKATSWTPLAEAMYTAIGYFTQNTALRLNSADFLTQADLAAYAAPPAWASNHLYAAGAKVSYGGVSYITYLGGTSSTTPPPGDTVVWTPVVVPTVTTVDPVPVDYWCRKNNILFITEGSSTTDRQGWDNIVGMVDFAVANGDGASTAACGTFAGSSLLDDLAYYGWQGDIWNGIVGKDDGIHEYGRIKTWVVESAVGPEVVDDPCDPATLLSDTALKGSRTVNPDGSITETDKFSAASEALFRVDLEKALTEILKGMSSGSAASVISSSRSGEGALYQAIFWPSLKGVDENIPVKWLGEVHALFVDELGNTYEDTDQNRQLDPFDPTNNPDGDQRVTIFFNSDPNVNRTVACYGTVVNSACVGTTKEVAEVKYLWAAADNLAAITDADIVSNRSNINNADDASYISATGKRNIFTWNDLNNDGIVQKDTEILPFVADWGGIPDAPSASVAYGDRGGMAEGAIYKDFGLTSQVEMDSLINWMRGLDQANMRPRQVSLTVNGVTTNPIWRLGDVVNSTPWVVGRPAENYHLLYQDKTFAAFLGRYMHRRTVIYVGGNDGMLHAINGGFYDEGLQKFCLADTCLPADEAGKPALGSELWAYVPYNLAPHLKSLADPNYGHKYYVDQRPRIFDVRIFTPEAACTNDPNDVQCIHPYGWGTILVGGMRLGGTPVPADGDLGMAGDQRIFASSYFIFDITNPEKPPVLMGEMTHRDAQVGGVDQAELGFTTGIPTMVPMMDKNSDGTITNAADTAWYLVFGNGPSYLNGTVDPGVKPTVFVMPMTWLAGLSGEQELRFPYYTGLVENTALGHDSGGFALPGVGATEYGFVSDPITVDFELFSDYKANVVYMGTLEQHATLDAANPPFGKMYRLVIGNRSYASGSQKQVWTDPAAWFTNLLIDVHQPVTAAPSVGWDGKNYWVYFGTGRFFNPTLDTPDHTQQSYYGIKEPMVPAHHLQNDPIPAYCEEVFSWAEVEKTPLNHDATPGAAGLLDVSDIAVHYDTATGQTTVDGCPADLQALIDGAANQYQTLIDYIVGTSAGCEKTSFGTDGWYRDFEDLGERNLGQAALLGGLVTFTTYIPSAHVCEKEGASNLYAVYYQTGTAWKVPVFSGTYGMNGDEVAYKYELGKGLAFTSNLHVGGETGSTAVVQTSTGAIVSVHQANLPLQEGKTGRKSWFEGLPQTPTPAP